MDKEDWKVVLEVFLAALLPFLGSLLFSPCRHRIWYCLPQKTSPRMRDEVAHSLSSLFPLPTSLTIQVARSIFLLSSNTSCSPRFSRALRKWSRMGKGGGMVQLLKEKRRLLDQSRSQSKPSGFTLLSSVYCQGWWWVRRWLETSGDCAPRREGSIQTKTSSLLVKTVAKTSHNLLLPY